jgi:hypothetical protein
MVGITALRSQACGAWLVACRDPLKLHVFALDKLDFQQIRSPDIMKFFDGYAPIYIEWWVHAPQTRIR